MGLSRVGLLLLDVLCKAWQGRLRYSNFFFPEKFCIFASRNKKETERLEKLKILPDCFSIQIVKHKNKKFLLLLQGPPIVKASGWTKLAAGLLLSRFSHVQPCETPQTAAHQAPPSLGPSLHPVNTFNWTKGAKRREIEVVDLPWKPDTPRYQPLRRESWKWQNKIIDQI